MANKYLDLTGQRYGHLAVISISIERTTAGKARWECRCDCGVLTTVDARNLRSGSITSCGCFRRDRMASMNYRHGLSKTPEHDAWRHLLDRCLNTRSPLYASYGGRGITVCGQWRASFESFISDMGMRPSPQHSIDRIDNDGPYSPENCRWATMTVQQRNKRSNTLLAYHGRTLTLSGWAETVGISVAVLCARIKKGWSVERALTIPLDLHHSNRSTRRTTRSSA